MYVFLPSWPIDRLRLPGGAPSWAGAAPADERPFATVVETGGRRLLAAVGPAAAAAGLMPGMPLADALSFVPGLATAAAEPAADAAALARLAEWCGRYSPWTAPDGANGVKIEITGCAHLWGIEDAPSDRREPARAERGGGEAQLAADLARRLARRNIAHRIAVAGTVGAAWALARFAAAEERPALPPSGEERQALAPLPVEALRLDPATAAGLRRVGLRRVGELYPMPRGALARRFGESVARRLDQALGALPEPLSPLGETPVRRVRLSFAEPIADPADLARAIDRLAGDLAARLAREGMGARWLGLAFHRVDGRVEHIRLGTARPTRDPRHLAGLFAAKLESVDPGLGVEDMILALFAAEPLPAEQTRLGPLPPQATVATPSPASGGGLGRGLAGGDTEASLAALIDCLGARLGLEAIGRVEQRASHIPERASAFVPVASPHPNPPPLAGEGARCACGGRMGTLRKPPRPVRLFAPPEPIEAAWVLPDEPPFRFTWRRRAHRVRRADGPERIAEEWWTADGSAAADAIRDYYRIEDEAGRRFWLFRAGLPGNPPPRWFVHGVFA
jgi:protein ImuB